MSEGVKIRRQLGPGDLEAIVALHERLYSREYGVDSSFVAFVAAAVARAEERGWPNEREGVWILGRDGEFAGCLGFTDEGDDVAMLRWFVFDPSLRGIGLGRRLVGELLDEAEAFGYQLMRLETFSELRAAAHLYRTHGFEVVWAETGPRWGRDEITYQRYELELPRSSGFPGATAAALRTA